MKDLFLSFKKKIISHIFSNPKSQIKINLGQISIVLHVHLKKLRKIFSKGENEFLTEKKNLELFFG